ncbi:MULTISPECIES: OmpP1/FadL family transporter [unclassified Pseudomonas]|uniref:OmpP1/FadL family transporter n=1 Tax=unclassified Pseudomonas TaxID=196821 RepID=UPI000BC71CAF|nr:MULTISPECIES: outer membrane protein transport protein [unclassified Pseudomonas]PVZ13940.1 long-chain fatty acid transport protein [Pseudomonas sp. URIL14HWK12:I12]PVZ24246.1 long-chain fatty acid transport protein [Pseudomonas sp. URIL14HWK12:I10]PVZ33115.1 long-chain fatty acid transport protein [Pseudomonas sp. URIL14HWK12:I11]SNZ10448.1 long-chain fatty acid transport protein [Pseudomonas sp. URIL14HWK12:I9]
MKNNVMIKSGLGIAITLASSQLFASGFAINEQTVSGMGTSFAGRSSAAEDASTVSSNPAGMARLKQEQFTVGAAAIYAKTDIDGRNAAAQGSNEGDMVPLVGIPMGYYVKPLDDHWSVGFGVYVPFGLSTDYESGYAGRYFADKSVVKVLTFQPTVSYAFNDRVSIGFGPTINRIEGELTSRVPGGPFGDGSVKIKGDDTAVGYTIGLLVQATDKTRLGLAYHSKVSYNLDGHVKAEGGALPALGVAGKYDASLSLDTPESVDASFTHQFDDHWTLYGGSTWTRWSRLQSIDVENDNPRLGTISEEEKWHDTWAHSLGLAYKVNPQWTLRTGVMLDQSPTNNTDRSPRIPSGDRRIFSVGAGYSPTQNLTIDVAYSYLKEEDVDINLASATRGRYNATYKNSSHNVGTSLTYRF